MGDLGIGAYKGTEQLYNHPDVLYILTKEDAQSIAKEKIGRYLSEEVLSLVKKGIESGLACWSEVMEDAIYEAVSSKNHL